MKRPTITYHEDYREIAENRLQGLVNPCWVVDGRWFMSRREALRQARNTRPSIETQSTSKTGSRRR